MLTRVEERKPHKVGNQPMDIWDIIDLLVGSSFVKIYDDWNQEKDWSLNHLENPEIRNVVITG